MNKSKELIGIQRTWKLVNAKELEAKTEGMNQAQCDAYVKKHAIWKRVYP